MGKHSSASGHAALVLKRHSASDLRFAFTPNQPDRPERSGLARPLKIFAARMLRSWVRLFLISLCPILCPIFTSAATSLRGSKYPTNNDLADFGTGELLVRWRRGRGANRSKRLKRLVGASGFEPPASWTRTRRSNQAEPRPDFSTGLLQSTGSQPGCQCPKSFPKSSLNFSLFFATKMRYSVPNRRGVNWLRVEAM